MRDGELDLRPDDSLMRYLRRRLQGFSIVSLRLDGAAVVKVVTERVRNGDVVCFEFNMLTEELVKCEC